MTHCFLAGGKSFPCNDLAMIFLSVASMVMGGDIDTRVLWVSRVGREIFRIKSYEKRYSRKLLPANTRCDIMRSEGLRHFFLWFTRRMRYSGVRCFHRVTRRVRAKESAQGEPG
jgi:hypothetical protein